MGRQPRRRKHIPQRTCVACRTGQAKVALVRIVRTPEGEVLVDRTGKRNGRGAYLCPQRQCWEQALAHGQLERALRVTLTSEAKALLLQTAVGFPQRLPTQPEPGEDGAKGGSADE